MSFTGLTQKTSPISQHQSLSEQAHQHIAVIDDNRESRMAVHFVLSDKDYRISELETQPGIDTEYYCEPAAAG